MVKGLINSGIIELFCAAGSGGSVDVQVTYDPATGNIRDVNGHALTVVNSTGGTAPVIVTSSTGTQTTINVPPGTTTRTAAQLAAIGITTRSQAGGYSLSSP